MNTDIRLAVTMPDHPKTLRLLAAARSLLADAPPETLLELAAEAAAFRLVALWTWTGENRPDRGDLSGLTDAQIEQRAGWQGPVGLVQILVHSGYIDGPPMQRRVHKWVLHNGYASGAIRRSEAARKAGKQSASQRALKRGIKAPSPSPSPSPSPEEEKTTTMSSGNGTARPVVARERIETALVRDAVFEFWRWWTEKPAAKFTPDRRRKVQARLAEGYGPMVIVRGILGCCDDPFNRGENDRQREYVDLELICRSGSKLENFADRKGEANAARQVERFGQSGFTEHAARLQGAGHGSAGGVAGASGSRSGTGDSGTRPSQPPLRARSDA